MVERAQADGPQTEPLPVEAGRHHIETGSAVEFRLLPGQCVELRVSADGLVSLRVSATEALPSSPLTAVPEVKQPTAAARLEETTDAPAEKQDRVTVSGRLAHVPAFRTTPKGVRIARLTIAEHLDTESTTWRTVLAFGKRAEDLEQQPLAKGQAIEVIGYPHQRQVTERGVKKTVEEIYATAIKRR